jgi:two-component system, LytTR family, sensor kinase
MKPVIMNKKLKKFLLTALLLMFLGNLMAFILEPSFVHDPKTWLTNCLFSVGLGYPMMLVSRLVTRRFGDRISWEINPVKKIASTLGVVIILAIVITLLLNYIFIYRIQGVTVGQYLRTTILLLLLQILVIVYIFSIITAVEFFKKWKEGLIKQQSLQRKAIELQLETLKNQVNPHFLFNSLNTLTSLIHKDADKAVQFTIQLADIYRYALENKDKPTVPWLVEKKFVENYLSMQQIRFSSNIAVSIAVGGDEKFEVIPLSVQMLVENAIKHNIITADDPLEIAIYVENNFLVVRNKLQLKSSVEYSENIGLANIKQQYEILAGQKVDVSRESGFFTVKLPFLANK